MALKNLRDKFNQSKTKAREKIAEFKEAAGEKVGMVYMAGVLTLVRGTLALNSLKEILNPSFWTLIEKGETAKVEKMLAKNPALATAFLDKEDSLTPLHVAAGFGQAGIVSALLRHGADAAALDRNDMSALYYAVTNGASGTAQLLLENNDPSINRIMREETLVMHAAGKGDLAMLRLLEQHGARLDITTSYGKSVLSEVLDNMRFGSKDFDKQKKLQQTLDYLEANADKILTASFKGRTMLMDAARSNAELATFIIKNDKHRSIDAVYVYPDALVHGQPEYPEVETALKNAVGRGEKELVKLMLENGARQDIDYQGSQTPLMLAVSHRNKDSAKALLESDASTVNTLYTDRRSTFLGMDNDRGQGDIVHSALTLAVKYADAETVRMLIASGARQDLATTKTPLQIAEERKDAEMINALKAPAPPKAAPRAPSLP